MKTIKNYCDQSVQCHDHSPFNKSTVALPPKVHRICQIPIISMIAKISNKHAGQHTSTKGKFLYAITDNNNTKYNQKLNYNHLCVLRTIPLHLTCYAFMLAWIKLKTPF